MGRELHRARVIVNAAGGWADDIADLAGAMRIRAEARRRTAIVMDPPAGLDPAGLPCVDFIGTGAHIKPLARRLTASLGDATLNPAQDVRLDEMDNAVPADWIGRETLTEVCRIAHSWTGPRTFVPYGDPVVGLDPSVPDFYRHAAYGGYGIVIAPSLAWVLVALWHDGRLPDVFVSSGILVSNQCPSRRNLTPGTDASSSEMALMM